MNLKAGDKVRFLNEKGGGIISSIINKTTAVVTSDDGFDIPYPLNQLVVINDALNSTPPEKPAPPLPEPAHSISEPVFENKKQEGIYIAFSPETPEDINSSNFNIRFINHTPYQTTFTCSVLQNNKYLTLETGKTKAFESILFYTLEKSNLETFSNFKIDVLFFDDDEHDYHFPVSEMIKFKIVKLYKENIFRKNDFVSEEAHIITVSHLYEKNYELNNLSSEDLSTKLFQKKTHSDNSKTSIPHSKNNPQYEMEIDLHIEELMDDYSRLSNSEIVSIQLKHFQNAMDKAIAGNYRKLIVIHGVGTGVLKKEVCKITSDTYNLKYYDASYERYGFGATEIIII